MNPAQPTLFVVDDDPATITVVNRMLSGEGRIRFATDGESALRLARLNPPDLVLLDIEMPGMRGLDVCAELKRDPLLRDIPVIFLTGHDDEATEIAGFAAGGVDFIAKPPSAALLQARVRTHLRLKKMSDALREAALIDGLTGITNRRRFDESLASEWLRAVRAHRPLAMVMIDIDHFKAYNDHYGHQAGDHALRDVAQAMEAALLRPGDHVARYGGEEFVLLLPETDTDGALAVARRLREAVDALAIPHAHSPVAPLLTVSMGVSAYDASCRDWRQAGADARNNDAFPPYTGEDLLAAADHALYAAKSAGRHRVASLALDQRDRPQTARVRIGDHDGD